MWWVVLLQGIAAIIIGILVFTDPATTLITMTIFLGVWWFIGGIFDLVRIFLDHENWGWKLASGILGIIAGLILIRHPLWSAILIPTTLVWILGFIGIVIGVMSIVQAFRASAGHGHPRRPEHWVRPDPPVRQRAEGEGARRGGRGPGDHRWHRRRVHVLQDQGPGRLSPCRGRRSYTAGGIVKCPAGARKFGYPSRTCGATRVSSCAFVTA